MHYSPEATHEEPLLLKEKQYLMRYYTIAIVKIIKYTVLEIQLVSNENLGENALVFQLQPLPGKRNYCQVTVTLTNVLVI